MSFARVALLLTMALPLAACASLRLSDADREYFWKLQRDDTFGGVEFEERCHVHHVRTMPAEVPVEAGMCVEDELYMLAKVNRFPNSFMFVQSCTCEDMGEPPVFRMVCPRCRGAEARWLAQRVGE